MIRIPINRVKDDLWRVLRMAEKEGVIITRHGVPAGAPQSELLEDYPGLEPEDIQAALLYAAGLVEAERVHPVAMTA